MTRTVETTIVDDNAIIINWALRRLQVPPLAREDGFQGGAVGLLKAARRFYPDKGSFRSFAGSHVLEEVRLAVGWDRRTRAENVPVDEHAAADEGDHAECRARPTTRQWEDPVCCEAARRERIAAVDAFLDGLDPDDRYLYRRLYFDDATQTAVAAELGINKMTVSRRVARLDECARLALGAYAPAA